MHGSSYRYMYMYMYTYYVHVLTIPTGTRYRPLRGAGTAPTGTGAAGSVGGRVGGAYGQTTTCG